MIVRSDVPAKGPDAGSVGLWLCPARATTPWSAWSARRSWLEVFWDHVLSRGECSESLVTHDGQLHCTSVHQRCPFEALTQIQYVPLAGQ